MVVVHRWVLDARTELHFLYSVDSIISVVTVNASVLLCITFLVFGETDKEEQ